MLSLLARRCSSPAVLSAPSTRAFTVSAMMRSDDRTPTAGATASSKGFNKREKAEEDRYILERERERFRKAKLALEKQKQELDKLEEDHANEQKK